MNPSSKPKTASDWLDLEEACEAALSLSREVASHLDGGAGVGVYLPLLRRQLDLAEEVRSRIARLGGLGGGDAGRQNERRQRVIGHLVELLDLEQSNQTLLSRRGARISSGTRMGAAAIGA